MQQIFVLNSIITIPEPILLKFGRLAGFQNRYQPGLKHIIYIVYKQKSWYSNMQNY